MITNNFTSTTNWHLKIIKYSSVTQKSISRDSQQFVGVRSNSITYSLPCHHSPRPLQVVHYRRRHLLVAEILSFKTLAVQTEIIHHIRLSMLRRQATFMQSLLFYLLLHFASPVAAKSRFVRFVSQQLAGCVQSLLTVSRADGPREESFRS